MSANRDQPRFSFPSDMVYRLSVEQYHAAIRAGVFTDDDPIELLEGMLVFKMAKNPPHRIALAKLLRALAPLVPEGWSLQVQDPITLADGEPEPDLAVIVGLAEDYPDAHPGPSAVPLVIEVADTSLEHDRGIKLRSYARAGIPAYWVVNLVDRRIEVYSSPDPAASPPVYRALATFDASAAVELVIAGVTRGSVRVADVLP